jgi:hypothetical protein
MPLYNQNHDFSRGVFHRTPHHWALCVASPAKIYGDTQRSWGIRIMSDTDNWIILMVQHTHTQKKKIAQLSQLRVEPKYAGTRVCK